MIDARHAGTVQNIATVRICRIREVQVGMVRVGILQSVITTIVAEREIRGIDIAEVLPLRIGVEVEEMTITEITLAIENGVITIMTTEAVQGVAVETEKGGERVDAIARRGLAGTGMKRLETGIDQERDIEADLDLEIEIDLLTGPETDLGIEIVADLVIDLEIEKDLVIEEKGIVKTIDRVDAVAKARTKGTMTA